MFEALLGVVPVKPANCSGKNTSSTFEGRKISEGIAVCPSSDWILIAANVINDCLIMCRKSRRTGELSCVLMRSSKNIVIPAGSTGVTIPSFVNSHQLLTFALDIGRDVCNESSSTGRTKAVHINPVFSLLQSAEHPWNCCSSITPEFFLSLFGPEFDLCKAPILLIGSQNGNIYFTNFKCSVSKEKEGSILGPLYSLEQPVVGIHLASFPQKKLTNDNDPLAIAWDVEEESEERTDNEVPNAIIFVGQRGKISICHSNSLHSGESKSFPSLVEFQVPAPLTSSILVPKSCLLFTTLQGLYRICLRQECAKCFEEKLPNLASAPCSIRIPHVSFKFPEKIVDTSCVGYILKTRTSDSYCCTSESRDDPLLCSYVSVDGSLANLQVEIHKATSISVGQNAAIVGQEIKQCLQSIQVVGEKISKAKKKITLLNTILTDFKTVLDLLCAFGGACTRNCEIFRSSIPFACSFASTHEDVGVKIKKFFMDVRLTYNIPETETGQSHYDELGTGWSFLITSSSNASRSGSSSSSKSVSLMGMVPGDSICVRVEIESETTEGRPLVGSIHCFMHYTPHYLCESVLKDTLAFDWKKFKGVSLFLCNKTFTILDFYQSSKSMLHGDSKETLSSVQRKAVNQILTSPSLIASSKPASALLYSISLPISPDRALCAILASSHSITRESLSKLDARSLGSKLICALVPAANVDSTTGQNPKTVLFSSFDGSSTTFEVNSTELSAALTEEGRWCSEPLKLLIRSSSKHCITQVVSAIRMIMGSGDLAGFGTKLGKEDGPALPHAHTQGQLRERLQEMQHLRKEVGNMKEELSAASRERETNCMKSDTYDKKLQLLKSRTFSLFCKLRELS